MKLRFRQYGGYTGLISGVDEIDTEAMPEKEAQYLTQLVKDSSILEMRSEKSTQGRDLQKYDITVETTDGIRQVSFDDMTMPENVIPLLQYLQSLATPKQPQ